MGSWLVAYHVNGMIYHFPVSMLHNVSQCAHQFIVAQHTVGPPTMTESVHKSNNVALGSKWVSKYYLMIMMNHKVETPWFIFSVLFTNMIWKVSTDESVNVGVQIFVGVLLIKGLKKILRRPKKRDIRLSHGLKPHVELLHGSIIILFLLSLVQIIISI